MTLRAARSLCGATGREAPGLLRRPHPPRCGREGAETSRGLGPGHHAGQPLSSFRVRQALWAGAVPLLSPVWALGPRAAEPAGLCPPERLQRISAPGAPLC